MIEIIESLTRGPGRPGKPGWPKRKIFVQN